MLTRRKYTASDTLVVPAGVKLMVVHGGGGGGGGAGGNLGANSAPPRAAGGGAGGGAPRGCVSIAVVPGETLTLTCGAGGTGGTGGVVGVPVATSGGAGGDSIITGSTSGEVARFKGGGLGRGGTATNDYAIPGGRYQGTAAPAFHVGEKGSPGLGGASAGDGNSFPGLTLAGRRGYAALSTHASNHTSAAGTNGTIDGAWGGGIGGGGGGQGPFGSLGGNGGNGGNASSGGSGTNATAGSAGSEGSGGGGGGGGGNGFIAPGNGGNGGAGGAGVLILEWVD